MRILMTTAIAIALFSTGCKAASEIAPPRPSNAESANAKPGDPLSALAKDGTAKSSFPTGAVERLNAIMRRSKNAIDTFDKIVPGIREANKAGKGSAGKAELAKLYGEAKSANADLIAEGKKLDATGEYYDVVIFSGMTLFAGKVEKELEEEIAALGSSKPRAQ
jgi:hypothetical protein